MTTLHQPSGQEKKNVRKRVGSRVLSCAIAAALLAGCGGGGGGSTPPVSSKPGGSTQTVKMTIKVPGKNGMNVHGKRVPLYISRSTLGMGIDWTPAATGFADHAPLGVPAFGVALDPNAFPYDGTTGMGCADAGNGDGSFNCTFYIPGVPVGYLDFKVTMWDGDPANCSLGGGTYGSGCTFATAQPLSTNVVNNQLILQNQNNDPSVNFSLLPVVDSVAVSSNPTTMVDGTAGSGTLNVTAKDADGNVIIGSDRFVDKNGNNLTITVSSASSHVLFGGNPTVSFTTPNGSNFMSAAYSYDGADMSTSLDNLFSVTSPTSLFVNGSIANFDLVFTKSSTGVSVPSAPQVGLSATTAGAPGAIVAGPAADTHVYTIENGKIAAINTNTGTIDTEFAVTGTPTGIALGADNDIWYLDGASDKVGKFNPLTADATLGPFVESASAVGTGVVGITRASDSQMYVLNNNGGTFPAAIRKINAQTMTATDAFGGWGPGFTQISSGGPFDNGDNGLCLAQGSWVACYDITLNSVPGGIAPAATPNAILIGPDGLIYAGGANAIDVLQYTGGGLIRKWTYATSGTVNGLTVGHDGAIWFTESASSSGDLIGRVQPASGAKGTLNEYGAQIFGSTPPSASATPYGIALGADNNLWFTDDSVNSAVDQVVP